ncbi:hypothetical protein PSPO01_04189 [Paraphaeosphaeria sporulosa]
MLLPVGRAALGVVGCVGSSCSRPGVYALAGVVAGARARRRRGLRLEQGAKQHTSSARNKRMRFTADAHGGNGGLCTVHGGQRVRRAVGRKGPAARPITRPHSVVTSTLQLPCGCRDTAPSGRWPCFTPSFQMAATGLPQWLVAGWPLWRPSHTALPIPPPVHQALHHDQLVVESAISSPPCAQELTARRRRNTADVTPGQWIRRLLSRIAPVCTDALSLQDRRACRPTCQKKPAPKYRVPLPFHWPREPLLSLFISACSSRLRLNSTAPNTAQ